MYPSTRNAKGGGISPPMRRIYLFGDQFKEGPSLYKLLLICMITQRDEVDPETSYISKGFPVDKYVQPCHSV